MKRAHMKPEDKRHVNLQTLVTLSERRKLLRMVKATRRSISDILRDGLQTEFKRWEETCASDK